MLAGWQRVPRAVRVGLGIAVTSYGALVAILYSSQRSLIFPGSMRSRNSDAAEAMADGRMIPLRTAAGEAIQLWYGAAVRPDGSPDPQAALRPTILYFHGNGSLQTDSDWEFRQFRRLGANVAIPEYPGYGAASGRASERGCYAGASAAYDYLRQAGAVDPRRLVVAGFSLGGAVAIDLAARQPVGGVATFSTFTSMVEMASRQYPWAPVPLLLEYRFENLPKIRRVRCPLLLAHGAADTLVPPPMAARLAAEAGGHVTRVEIPEAGHNNLFQVGGQPLLAALQQLLRQLPGGD